MKLLMVNTVCGIGSTGRICAEIADLVSGTGDGCRIAYGRGKVPPAAEKYAYRIEGTAAVLADALTTRLADSAGFNSGHATERLIGWAEEFDPDVIHLHNLHGYYINAEKLFRYLKKAGKPVVWTLHDCWAFTGHCAHFTMRGCGKWKTGCGKCPALSDYPASLFYDGSERNYVRKKECFTGVPDLTVVTPSQWLAELVGQSFLRDYPVKVINNGIDLSVFRPTPSDFRKKHGIPENMKLVLGVSYGWGVKKGLDVFESLYSRLDRQKYRIVLVGCDEKTAKSLPGGIIAIKRTESREELAAIYTAADVFVNPTREDNYPTVNMEAEACGTPVVTFRTGGSPENVFLIPVRLLTAMILMHWNTKSSEFAATNRSPLPTASDVRQCST